MILGWVLWLFIAPHLFMLDGLLAAHLPIRVDLALAVAFVCALHARPTALPGLLVLAALGRSMLVDGNLPLHFLALGVPIAVLLPIRAALWRHSVLLQFAAAGFLAWTVPRVAGLLARISEQPAVPHQSGLVELVTASLCVPIAAWVLRSLPPLSLFVEGEE